MKLLTVLLALLTASPASALATLRFIPQPILEEVLTQGSPVTNGLNGPNRAGWVSVGEQNGAMEPLMFAAITGDADTAERYWPVVVQSFAHEKSDGSFAYASFVGTKSFDVRGLPTDEAFWISQSAFAVLLLQQSTLSGTYNARIRSYTPQYREAVSWLSQPQQVAMMEFVDSGATNRLLIDAEALLLGGSLSGSATAERAGWQILDRALAAQTAEGYFPEHSGPDTSYNAVSCLALAEIELFVPDARILHALDRGANWELSRIAQNGKIDSSGNTRTGPGFFTGGGKPYRIDYHRVARMLAIYGALRKRQGFLDVAHNVASYKKAHYYEP